MNAQKITTFSPLDGADGKPDYDPEAKNLPGTTFGLEVEFALATLYGDQTDPHPEDTRQVYGIIDQDEEEKNYANSHETADLQGHIRDAINELLHSQDRAKADFDTDENRLNGNWYVSNDMSVFGPVNLDKGQGIYKFTAVELKSPPFYYCPESLLEVQAVCHMLTNKYRISATGNRSASVHCHIGFGKTGYDVRVLRNVMAIWWVFEPQFYTMVEKHRETNMYSRMARRHSTLSIDARSEHKSIGDVLEEIMEEDIRFLPYLFTQHSFQRVGFNLSNISSNRTLGSKQTIEFRMHEASVQPLEISHWISFCTNLVVFAGLVKTEKLHLWLRMHLDDEKDGVDYGVVELLCALKMPAQAEWFARKIQRMKAEGLDRVSESELDDGDELEGLEI